MSDNNNTGLKWALGIGTVALLYTTVIKPDVIVPAQTLQYLKRLRVQLPGIKLKDNQLIFDLRIENPNDVPMNIKSIVGDVFLFSNNGRTQYKLGNVTRYGTTVIRPNNETPYPFAIRLKAVQLLGYFTDILTGKIRGQVLVFKGTANINGYVLPVNESYRIA